MTTSSGYQLQIEELCKRYGDTVALRGMTERQLDRPPGAAAVRTNSRAANPHGLRISESASWKTCLVMGGEPIEGDG